MKAAFIFIPLSLIFAISLAQKTSIKFGDVSLQEVAMVSYEKDSSASAVILADRGTSSVRYQQDIGFTLRFERFIRIKVFTTHGLQWGNFTIPLSKKKSAREKLDFIKAATYNLVDGKIVETKIKNDGIFIEDYDATTDVVKVTCPHVVEGSIIEIAYRTISESLSGVPGWSFQSSIPTVLSEYRTNIPEYFQYHKYIRGKLPIDVSQEAVPNSIWITSFERQGKNILRSTTSTNRVDFVEVRDRWTATNIPAFKPEPFMASASHFSPKITLELASVKYPDLPPQYYNKGTWDDVNARFMESKNFGGQITGNDFLKDIVDALTSGLVLPQEKIAVICNFIKANVTWNGLATRYPLLPLEEVVQNKIGNSAEINLLFASMMAKADISVSPVLLSTREHGPVDQGVPSASQFDYVICLAQVNDRSYLLDATDPLLPLGLLPEECINGLGFAISSEGYQWISLDSKFKTKEVTLANITLTAAGKLHGKLELQHNGYAAFNKRKKYLLNGEAAYLRDLIGSRSWNLTSSTILNAEKIQNDFTEVHEVEISENVTSFGDLVYVDPFICKTYEYNPFREEERRYPVDFGSLKREVHFFKLTLPENYSIVELPESKSLMMPGNGATLTYNVSRSGNLIAVTSMLNINKTLFSENEYPYLREFFNQLLAKQSEQIVLKRHGL